MNSYEEESFSSLMDLRPAEDVFISRQLYFSVFQHIHQTVAAHRLSGITQEASGGRLSSNATSAHFDVDAATNRKVTEKSLAKMDQLSPRETSGTRPNHLQPAGIFQ